MNRISMQGIKRIDFFTAWDGTQGAHILKTGGDITYPWNSRCPTTKLMFCVIILDDDTVVTGEAMLTSLIPSDIEAGKIVALNNAKLKLKD
jgi:hypothetical protein